MLDSAVKRVIVEMSVLLVFRASGASAESAERKAQTQQSPDRRVNLLRDLLVHAERKALHLRSQDLLVQRVTEENKGSPEETQQSRVHTVLRARVAAQGSKESEGKRVKHQPSLDRRAFMGDTGTMGTRDPKGMLETAGSAESRERPVMSAQSVHAVRKVSAGMSQLWERVNCKQQLTSSELEMQLGSQHCNTHER